MRFVDVESTRYQIAHRYMIRLRPEDFAGPQLARLAAAAGVDAETFAREFGYLAARPFATKRML